VTDLEEDAKVILARIEGKIESHAAELTRHVGEERAWQATTSEKIGRIDASLRGNGTPGINVRLDRIEQREKGRAKLTWIAVTSALGALAASVAAFVAKK